MTEVKTVDPLSDMAKTLQQAVAELSRIYSEVSPWLPHMRHGVIDSGSFCARASAQLEQAVRLFSDDAIHRALCDLADPQRKSAIAAAFADKYFSSGKIEIAQRFAQLAISINFRDAVASRTLTKCNDLQLGRQETTEEYLKHSWCNRPFNHLEITDHGDSYSCCPHWLPVPLGNMDSTPWQKVWNSKVAELIRASIVDGSFRYCNTVYCSSIAARTLPPRDAPDNLREPRSAPGYVALSYDPSCNLACPSCRRQIVSLGNSKQDVFTPVLENMDGMLELADEILVTGSGDPFASNHFRKLIKAYTAKSHDKRRLFLLTNAQLCDEQAWDELGLAGNVMQLSVSVDAAREETYRIVRRPGNFSRLLKNLKFISEKRQAGDILAFSLNFVVQAANFREMPEFVALAKEVKADSVGFTRIRNTGTFTHTEFDLVDVFRPQHPDHAEFLEVMKAPILHALPVTLLPPVEVVEEVVPAVV